ncbi:MAG: LacI family DNA-binding transcriptional regulator, partial [Methanobrevibacter sp.]|nr:LacI family DNA-binding transcriptional regulator [Methanobrevibacter sp.]
MATIRDVAQKAGVGVATVSRVLSENGYVKEETKQKVMEAIRELNYTPNEIARNLYYKRTGIVAVIIP